MSRIICLNIKKNLSGLHPDDAINLLILFIIYFPRRDDARWVDDQTTKSEVLEPTAYLTSVRSQNNCQAQ